MPEMDIEVASGLLNWGDLWMRVFAYMGWPDDVGARSAYIALGFADALAGLEEFRRDDLGLSELPENDFEDLIGAIRNQLEGDFRDLGGGWLALRLGEAKPPLPAKQVLTAGAILTLIRSIKEDNSNRTGRASLNKAIYLIEQAKCPSLLLVNRTDIWRCWKNYKNIAHLAAALCWCDRHKVEFNQVGFGIFLAVSRNFEKFGTSFLITDAKPLLNPTEIWSVPADLVLPDVSLRVGPLDQDDLRLLAQYRAPIPP